MAGVADSALCVEPQGQPPDAQPWAVSLRYDSGNFLARGGRRTGAIPEPLNRSVKPAELAQARIFKAALRDELARLNELASRLGGPLERSKASGSGPDNRESADIQASIDEVRRLLEGLQGRFGTAD